MSIVDSIEKIKDYTKNYSDADSFYDDTKSFDAVMMNFIVIGEMADKLSDNFTDSTNEIFTWAQVIGLRNIIAHNYFGIDAEEVWQIIGKSLIDLEKNIKIKGAIKKAQIKASISVNHELIKLNWIIGKSISEKIQIENWGASVVDNLSKDLQKQFPNQQGYSRSNLFSMRKWYEFYINSGLEETKVQQLVGQIPWGHNVLIITK